MTEYKFEYTCEIKHEDYSEYICTTCERNFEDDFEAVGYAFLRAALFEELDIEVKSIYVYEKALFDNVLLDVGKR